MLGTQTRGGRKIGADESTVLWRYPIIGQILLDIFVIEQWLKEVGLRIALTNETQFFETFFLKLTPPNFFAAGIEDGRGCFFPFPVPFDVSLALRSISFSVNKPSSSCWLNRLESSSNVDRSPEGNENILIIKWYTYFNLGSFFVCNGIQLDFRRPLFPSILRKGVILMYCF